MSDWTLPMTKLQAVNICLSSIGQTKVALVAEGGLDAEQADDLIDETSATIQGKGWHWNREILTISPDVSGFINLPNNVVHADTVNQSASVDAVMRGLKMYNREKNTFVFTVPLYLEVIQVLAWDMLPFQAKIFIAASASMILQQRILGADSIDKDLKQKAADAWTEIIRDDMNAGDYNMTYGSNSSANVVSERRPWF